MPSDSVKAYLRSLMNIQQTPFLWPNRAGEARKVSKSVRICSKVFRSVQVRPAIPRFSAFAPPPLRI